jgi:hypothetical protein
MTQYKIYGCGTPLFIESYSREVAEAVACEMHGFYVENLVTVEVVDDDVLSGDGADYCVEGSGRDADQS